MKDLRMILFLVFLLLGCDQENRIDCKDTAWIENEFPDDFFKKNPKFTINGDTLNITAVLREKNWHPIYYSAFSSQMIYLLDSAGCYHITEKLNENKVEFNIYSGHLSKEYKAKFNVKAFDIPSNRDQNYWQIMTLILQSDPINWKHSDELLQLYYDETSRSGKKLSMYELYEEVVSNGNDRSKELALYDTLVMLAKYNSQYVDTNLLKSIRDRLPRMKDEQNELIIEDQIPDHLKEKNE